MRPDSMLLRTTPAAMAMVVLLASLPAAGQGEARSGANAGLELRAGAIHSDNVTRISSDEIDGTIWSAGVALDVQRRGSRLNVDATGDLEWMEYPGNTFGSDVLGHFDGLVEFGLVPNKFVWVAQETYGQLRSDPTAAITPDNLADMHYFTTGPDLSLRTGSSTTLRLSGRYSLVESKAAGGAGGVPDSDRYRADLVLTRESSAVSSFSVQAVGERFKFKYVPAADYDRREAFLRYQARGSRTEVGADLGYSDIDPRVMGEASGGLLARLSLSRQLSPASRLSIGAGKQFSDPGQFLRSELLQTPGGLVGAADPFESRYFTAQWDFARNRTGFGFQAERNEERYENATVLDRTRTVWGAYFQRRLTPTLTLRADGRLIDQSYDAGFKDEEKNAGLALSWAPGRQLSWNLRVERFDRDSSVGLVEYAENRVALFAVWSPLTR